MSGVVENAIGAVSSSVPLKCLCVVLFICLFGVYGRKTIWLFKVFFLDLREAMNYGVSGLVELIPQDLTNLAYVIVAVVGYLLGPRLGYGVFLSACVLLLILGPLLVRFRQNYLSDKNFEFPAIKVFSFTEDYRSDAQPVVVIVLVELVGLVGYAAGFLFLRSL